MKKKYIEDVRFEQVDFTANPLELGEYEQCVFANCNFLQADLSGIIFIACEFKDCDLSNAQLAETSFREVKFKACKLLGLHFEDVSDFLFEVGFEHCTLSFSSFYQSKLKKTVFKNSILQEVDFTGADLAGATFAECDLAKTVFMNTNLEQADFRSATNFSIDPEANRIKKARFSMTGLIGLLHKYEINYE